MNQVATKEETPINRLRAQVAALTPELRNALPSHIKPEKFQRVVLTVVQQTPDLFDADRRSLLGACMKCAADGLVPDGREAALVIFNTKEKFKNDKGLDVERWVKKVQYMPMLGGILKRIRNSSEIASVQAHVIHENDQFVIRRGLSDTLEHTPLFPGDRGKMIGAYAVAKFRDGSDPVFEVMDINEIEAVRKVSRAATSGPWVAWFPEMARKTVFKRLSKWLPMDAEIEGVLKRDDEIGVEEPSAAIESVLVEHEQISHATSSRLDMLEGSLAGEDATDDATAMIAEIQALETPAALRAYESNLATRTRIKKMSAEQVERVSAAMKARGGS